MAEQFKRHYVSVDMYKTSSDTFEVVEGDTANLIIITLTDRGNPVDLTDCKVVVVFVRGGVPAEQDTDGHGVTISGEHHNIITVDLYASSYVNGSNTAEVQVWSGEDYKRLATSAWFNFKARRARVNENTLPAVPIFPMLSGMFKTLYNIARGVQAKWSTTNTEDPSFIQDKPVIGTDIQAATQGLTAATAVIANTASIPVHDTTHKRITWEQVKTWLQNLFDTVYAPISHKSRHATGGADALIANDIGAADRVHAARHKKGGADVLTPNDIGAAGIDANGKTLADQSSSKIVTLTDNTPVLLLEHAGCFIRISGSVNKTVTIPPNASLSFPIGTEIVIVDWLSSGRITIAPGSGVQIFWSDGTGGSKVSTNGAATFALKYIESNIWIGNRL